MTDITWPDKNTGDQVTAANMNEIKSATNSKYDSSDDTTLAAAGADAAYARQTSSGQASSGSSLTLNLNTPNQDIVMTANCTLAAPTLPAADQTQAGVIRFTQDASTAYTLSYNPASIKVVGGAIDISTLSGVYEMPWVRRGSIIHASIVGPFS